MRFVFKTSYDADIRWFKHGAQLFWYALLLLFMLLMPLYFVWTDNPYLLGEITAVLIFSIACLGLMLLIGQTGLASLGHAAFMAMGCYANILMLNAGLPWLIAFPLTPPVQRSVRSMMSPEIADRASVASARYTPCRRNTGRAMIVPKRPVSSPASGKAISHGSPALSIRVLA